MLNENQVESVVEYFKFQKTKFNLFYTNSFQVTKRAEIWLDLDRTFVM